ncbi:GNAT family N-acetyltransferase [Pseudomonas sp. B21-012]|uniref:GNAT family N-acetyltransferase n=1 Tax=unclassified Pseudomonas TaxID=196821 RepID=UPI00215FCD18|nr:MULTISPECIES: GNAT family N-acetyltransferase [unclassified Pseudomonas]UVL63639.1 GNAT family N-acetyltransferase [Pseudomonas sp. B21-032]UVM57951.1 GNAT family N-acetyltransferase [Pseudomonas sp. B21-012]
MTAAHPVVSIRPVTQNDFKQWCAHWAQYQAFYKVDIGMPTTQTTWARFFDSREPVHCAVAADGEQVHGFVHFVFHRSTWGRNDFCYLEDLYVCPSVRGQLLGKQLIEYVQGQAREHHCDRLYWHTQESNHTAQRLYDWIAEKPGVIEYRMAL